MQENHETISATDVIPQPAEYLTDGGNPSFAWIEQLTELMANPDKPRFSLHVCGRAVQEFLDGTGHVTEIAKAFSRIQVNFQSRKFDLDTIKAMMRRYSEKTIITQHNYANASLWRDLREFKNHAILFDQSGGRGLSPEIWPASIPGVKSGYAGGLGLDNLATELVKIKSAANGVMDYWIDAEGKLRNAQDRFDLTLARQFLDVVSAFDSDVDNADLTTN